MGNKTFTKNSVINLDEFYTLTSDGDSGIVLTFQEKRTRKRIDKETKKETGETEEYLFNEPRYFTRIVQALKRYVELSQNNCKTIEELLEKTNKMDVLLEKLDKEFRQFE